MSGHSRWSQIKHQKEATDQKRGQVFSKLLQAIAIAAKADPNPQFNPQLRAAIEKAKENNVPAENIERAIQRASLKSEALEELVLEGYGPGSVAMIVTAITDNPNRTIPELKKILASHEAKLADPGSVRWAFASPAPGSAAWLAKFPQAISTEDRAKLALLVGDLEHHEDVQRVFTNATQ